MKIIFRRPAKRSSFTKPMKHYCLIAASLLCCIHQCIAKSRAANGPYVQAMDGPSVFYARCIPDDNEGNKGTTTIYRVKKAGDEKVDSYNWYSPDGVILGWSPIAGKVAAMSLRERASSPDEQIEFAFHLGGKLLQSYTTASLKALGIEIGPSFEGDQARFKVIGCVQVPQTNEYDFVIESSSGERFAFDILTGKLRTP